MAIIRKSQLLTEYYFERTHVNKILTLELRTNKTANTYSQI